MRLICRGVQLKRLALAGVMLSITLGACGGQSESQGGASAQPSAQGPGDIVAQVASYQLVAKRPGRLIVALLSADNHWLSFGTVNMSFAFLGDKASTPAPQAGVPPQAAAFLAIPGTPTGKGQKPTLTDPADGRGLYGIESITFPQAGYWQVTATGETDHETRFSADAAFEVLAAPLVREPGDQALPSDNPLLGAAGVPRAAIDSRAATQDTIPDPELHRVSIAQALHAHEPALVVFSTPVYCVSRFCGPVTDMVQSLSHEYADRAAFIHVEIYRDFQANRLNQAAQDWLLTKSGDLREPWVFLIGADGRIIGSWDTMVTRGELEPALRALPAHR